MFYQLPKKMFTDKEFSKLSLQAIVLYSILKDRSSLSEYTGKLDKSGKAYIFFSRKEIAKLLRVSERTAIRYVKELEMAGLISFGSKTGCTSSPIYVSDILQIKKSAPKMEQTKSYDTDDVRELLFRQFMAG